MASRCVQSDSGTPAAAALNVELVWMAIVIVCNDDMYTRLVSSLALPIKQQSVSS